MAERSPTDSVAQRYRAGYVALMGRPNVGKSTLLNRMLGQKVSIVTPKPQTTRQSITGIKTTADGQLVYVDTPGIHAASGNALNRYMNRNARAVVRDVDVVLFLIEALKWTREDEFAFQSIGSTDAPVILVVNKIDRVRDKRDLLAFLAKKVDASRFTQVFLVSAARGDGIDDLERQVLNMLPFSPPLFDEDQFTDRSERFLAGELIREALMQRLHQELPYALAVEIEEFKREPNLLRIGAIIWVEREGQKQIVIGKNGETLKQVGSRARKELETLFGEKIFVRLWVKINRDWSDSEQSLRKLGFDDPAG